MATWTHVNIYLKFLLAAQLGGLAPARPIMVIIYHVTVMWWKQHDFQNQLGTEFPQN
jgi:hypothetical protein